MNIKKIVSTAIVFTTVSLFSNVSLNIINSLNTSQKSKKLIYELYKYNDNRYFWLGDKNALKLSKVMKALNNRFYNYKDKPLNRTKITQYLFLLDSGELNEYQKAKLDAMITASYIRLLRFIRIGDVNWRLVQKKIRSLKSRYGIDAAWEMKIKMMPSASVVYRYIHNGRVNALLYGSIGQKERYKAFIDILEYYREIPEFKKVKFGVTIKYGDRDKRIYQIKRRLLFLGYYPRNAPINRKFDKDLAYAIKKFRRSFNLRGGAYIDNKLIGYINLSKKYYIKKIIVNLDKTKVFLPSFGKTYIEVNIPEFIARFYKNRIEAFRTNAVVGSLKRPTPIFDDYLEYIVLNPTWTVPENLIKKDLIPNLKKYPNLFEMANLKAYQRGKEVKPDIKKLIAIDGTKKLSPYRIVQMPGPNNALGRIKFMFPNKYAVYLHDTPEKGLFSNRYRYNSSGCIRLEDPYGLLEQLKPYLKNRNYKKYINSGKTYRINLKKKIPIHIVYFTLEFEDGSPKFMYDAYMYDKMIEESTAGNIKPDFEMPEVRLIEVKNN